MLPSLRDACVYTYGYTKGFEHSLENKKNGRVNPPCRSSF